MINVDLEEEDDADADFVAGTSVTVNFTLKKIRKGAMSEVCITVEQTLVISSAT